MVGELEGLSHLIIDNGTSIEALNQNVGNITSIVNLIKDIADQRHSMPLSKQHVRENMVVDLRL